MNPWNPMIRPAKLSALGVLTALAAGHLLAAQHGATQPASQPSTKPTADTVEHYPCPPAPPLTGAQELESFVLQPGFQIELVASEPAVQDPVAIAFDADGRMWVSEMRGYMPDVYAHHEDEPIGRISVLEDSSGRGRYDKATVFLDKLYLPRAVSPIADGALVASPPHLWFCRDTQGGLNCDQKVEVSAKYGTGKDPEYGDNGLLWARDNWIYSASSHVRFRYAGNDKFESAVAPSRGQWGISQDDVGRLFFNYNSDQLRADLIPADYIARNPAYKATGVNYQVESDQKTWSSRPNPGINRGYEPGNLREGRLATVTATCGPTIFRGTALGDDAYGNAFIPEPAGNLVMRKQLIESQGLVKAVGVYHPGPPGMPKLDFLTSTDERFRPVNAATGPDGALYIVDMYRGVIQHRTYVTPYLRRQVFERGLEQPQHLGRIWRITRIGQARTPIVKLSRESSAKLIERLASPNGWVRDTAQRLLVERNDPASVAPLEQTAAAHANPLARLHALWTLAGTGKLKETTLLTALTDKDGRVSSAAIRLSEPYLSDGDGKILAAVLKQQYRPETRVQFALSIAGVKQARVEETLTAFLSDFAERPLIKDAVISGMAGREGEFLRRLLADPGWEKETPGRRGMIVALASAAFRSGKGPIATELFDAAATQGQTLHWRQLAILSGVTQISKGQSKPAKVALPATPTALLKLCDDADPTVSALARQAEKYVRWPGMPKLEPDVVPLTPEQQQSFTRGKEIFGAVCAQCHQPDGRGQEGKAPSLRDSPIALGPDVRLIRIVLNGAKGEWHVTGWSPNLEMPTLGVLDDGQIADALTYLRRSWDHAASPVDGATVARVRQEVGNRQAAWTEEELLAVGAPQGIAVSPGASTSVEKPAPAGNSK